MQELIPLGKYIYIYSIYLFNKFNTSQNSINLRKILLLFMQAKILKNGKDITGKQQFNPPSTPKGWTYQSMN